MLNSFYKAVAKSMEAIHTAIGPVLGEKSFASWALSIVLLVMGLRLLLVPIFVKSIKSQRQMALMQPKVAELRKKYKDDKATLNSELMKLQQEHGNPLLGCLPLVVQIPVFLSLYHVMRDLKPSFIGANGKVPTGAIGCLPSGTGQYCYKAAHGLSALTVENISNAKAFGVSISAAFTSPHNLLVFLHANTAAVRVSTVLLGIIMTATTFLTQHQTMKKNPPPADPSQAQIQKMMLYGGPALLFLFSFRSPLGVELYWVTTNLWTLGQQHIVLKRMGPAPVVTAPGTTPTGPPPKPNLVKQATTKAAITTTPTTPGQYGNVVGPGNPVYRQRTTQNKKKKRR